MTIDDYLNRISELRQKEARLYQKVIALEDIAASPKPASRFTGAEAGNKSGINGTENAFINAANASQEWKETANEYRICCERLELALDDLLYWEGRAIYRAYIYNETCNKDRLDGLNEILHTNDRAEILERLKTAKEHLRQVINQRGGKIRGMTLS